MAVENPTAIHCPSCLAPAIRTGNEITCEACDAVFVFSKKQGPTLKEQGPIEDHERRIQALEGQMPGAEEPAKTEQELQDEREETEDRGDL